MENQETTPDLFDLPSGVFVEEEYCEHTFQRELSFRELRARCEDEMRLWDRIGWQLRLRNQLHNDSYYKPIQPMEGMKKLKPRHRWWRPA